MLNSLRLSLQVRREHKKIKCSTQIVEARRKQNHAFMMELSAAGYEIVKRPAL